MQSKVKLSAYSFILTLIVNLVLIVCCVFTFNEKPGFWIILSILILLLAFGLLYGPIKIKIDSNYIIVQSFLLKHKIKIDGIESVELFQPTMGAYRLCASGGYFGYWGLFREGDIGRYVAYYGKASDCFLIRMKNGDKYVLGCENPKEIVEFVRKQIKFSQETNKNCEYSSFT